MTGAQHKVVGIGFGIASAIIITQKFGEPYGVLTLPASAIGCWIPDIDHDASKLGKKRKFVTSMTSKLLNILIVLGVAGATILAALTYFGFKDYGISSVQFLIGGGVVLFVAIVRSMTAKSKVFRWATKHRGIMHTLWPMAGIVCLAHMSEFPLWYWSFLGLAIGYMSHLIADMLTIAGCPILWPVFKSNIHILSFKTKDKICTTAAYGLAIVVVGVSVMLTMF